MNYYQGYTQFRELVITEVRKTNNFVKRGFF
jgi:hypothetical protein